MEDPYGDAGAQPGADANGLLKRKRSNSPERSNPSKITKTLPGANIDFLASVQAEALPLVDTDDSLNFIRTHFDLYGGVIERHESLAASLGAKLQAPNSIKRFERMFMSPIRILANHGKPTNTVTWLDIVKHYEKYPGQFKINQREGEKVYQFYARQSRVEITADDFEYIQSGQPQKVLPTGSVPADEEKELGTIEFLETRIGQITKLADQINSRGRQLMTRLKARRNALAARRDADVNGAGSGSGSGSETSPIEQRTGSPVSGFTAVNAQRDNASVTNGGVMTTSSFSKPLVSAAVKNELSTIFTSNRDRSSSSGGGGAGSGEYPLRTSKSRNRASDYYLPGAASPAQPSTPVTTAGVPARPTPAEKVDNDGPYRVEMLQRMERMNRYAIVKPPCDRCRRLQIDCQKNLTACLGCTKKHAKCSWKEVTKQELIDNPAPPKKVFRPPQWFLDQIASDKDYDKEQPSRERSGASSDAESKTQNPAPVLDNELLGEDSDDEDNDVPTIEKGTEQDIQVPEPGVLQNGTAPTVEGPHYDTAMSSAEPSVTPPPTGNNALAARNLSAESPYSPPQAESAQAGHQQAVNQASSRAGSHSSSYVRSEPPADPVKTEPNTNQEQHRLPGFPHILGDRIIDNPAIIGTATGDRLARDAEHAIDRLQPDAAAQHQPPAAGSLNNTTRV